MPRNVARRASGRASFTLVELLVVISIIIILASLISVAAALAIGKAKQTKILNEIQTMDGGIKKLAGDYGFSTVPDFTNSGISYGMGAGDPVAAWFRRAFPRSLDGVPTAGIGGVTADRLLYLYLMGFSNDPQHPLTGDGGPCSNPSTWGKYTRFDFNANRLVNGIRLNQFTGFSSAPNTTLIYQYVPLETLNAPYCLFSSVAYQPANLPTPLVAATNTYTGFGLGSYPPPWLAAGTNYSGIARPYFTQIAGVIAPCNPTTFQIISAGLDDDYGGSPVSSVLLYPSGANYSDGDRDNLTNFSQNTLGDAIQ